MTGVVLTDDGQVLGVRRVYCVGRNYWDHGIEMGGNPAREPPFFFSKPTDAVFSPHFGSTTLQLPYPPHTSDLHYECELVVFLGKQGAFISVDNALEHVFGYSVGVDFTRRDLQAAAKKQGRPWDCAKGFDFSGPVGHVVPKEKLSCSIGEMEMTLSVNGKVKQQTQLNKMIWNVAEIISNLSEQFVLHPGDVIFTGTPAGVGAVVPGDECHCTITGLPQLKVVVTPPLHSKERLPQPKDICNDEKASFGFSEKESEKVVLASLKNCKDDRFRTVMTHIITGLHETIKKVKPTADEFDAAIEFLTNTGKMCQGSRQEWILLSDVLGVSMLIDSINHSSKQETKVSPTESTVQGPFLGIHPMREFNADIAISKRSDATPCLYSGQVLSANTGLPIENAIIDVWMTDSDGHYSVQSESHQPEFNLVGQFRSLSDGRYQFRAIIPTSYTVPTDGPVGVILNKWGRNSMRPAHVHFKVTAPGYHTLITHLFVQSDPYLQEDAVFGVKSSLIYAFPLIDNESEAKELGLWKIPFSKCLFDLVLSPF